MHTWLSWSDSPSGQHNETDLLGYEHRGTIYSPSQILKYWTSYRSLKPYIGCHGTEGRNRTHKICTGHSSGDMYAIQPLPR